ncbi:MAG TPA: sugar transferase [Prolixibacteraceae bacterium]|jgi:lipopolysaccharide/colanic/teichoic acid biosynthesis glycosyltransferase
MDKDNKEKLKILHIAADPEFSSPMVYENYRIEIETLDTPFSVSQWITQNGWPDALICERKLPLDNGFEFYDFWVNQFDTGKRIPFILLDEDKNQDTISKASEKRIDEVLFKPIDADKLIQRILALRQEKHLPGNAPISEINGFKPYRFTFLKRTFDLLTASICLLITSPILLIFAIALRIETKGNIFYKSKRVGAGFKVFDFYKLRSMYPHSDQRLKELAHLNEYQKETSASQAEKTNPNIHSLNQAGGKSLSANGDSRITKVGYLMRKLNIDELPQLFNVLKGDLSMVGNRPLPIYEAELLTTADWIDRLHSPAGITGIWKVVSRRRLRSMTHDQRSSLQNKYFQVARHRNSFWNDIWIIVQTLPFLFKKGNA